QSGRRKLLRFEIIRTSRIVQAVAERRRPFSCYALTLQQGGRSHLVQSTPSPVRFARHLSPLPGGEERPLQGLAPHLAPTKWGRGGLRSEPVRGSAVPYAIVLTLAGRMCPHADHGRH